MNNARVGLVEEIEIVLKEETKKNKSHGKYKKIEKQDTTFELF